MHAESCYSKVDTLHLYRRREVPLDGHLSHQFGTSQLNLQCGSHFIKLHVRFHSKISCGALSVALLPYLSFHRFFKYTFHGFSFALKC